MHQLSRYLAFVMPTVTRRAYGRSGVPNMITSMLVNVSQTLHSTQSRIDYVGCGRWRWRAVEDSELSLLSRSSYKTIKAAAMAHKASESPKILGDTMLHHRFPARRYKRHTVPTIKPTRTRGFSIGAQGNVADEWLIQSSCMAALEITGKLPGKGWRRTYIKRHDKTLKASEPKPRHLVPKRTQNFNRTNVDGYFRLRAQVERKRTTAVASPSESSIEPPALALLKSSASTNDAGVLNLSNHHTSDFPLSSSGRMSHIHIPHTSHLSHNTPSMSHLPYHTHSHVDYHRNSSYNPEQMPIRYNTCIPVTLVAQSNL